VLGQIKHRPPAEVDRADIGRTSAVGTLSTLEEVLMIRSMIRTALFSATLVLVGSVAKAAAPSPAETEGNKMEKKGNVEEKGANAEKAKGSHMEKKGKAM
jgi:uncharacterized protein (DUF2147 family)